MTKKPENMSTPPEEIDDFLLLDWDEDSGLPVVSHKPTKADKAPVQNPKPEVQSNPRWPTPEEIDEFLLSDQDKDRAGVESVKTVSAADKAPVSNPKPEVQAKPEGPNFGKGADIVFVDADGTEYFYGVSNDGSLVMNKVEKPKEDPAKKHQEKDKKDMADARSSIGLEAESIHEAKPEQSQTDTEIVAGETKKLSKKENPEVQKWNDLLDQKNEINQKLAGTIEADEREKLETQKRQISRDMIAQGFDMMTEEEKEKYLAGSSNPFEKVENEMQERWEGALKTAGYPNEQAYKEYHQRAFIARELQSNYDDLINKAPWLLKGEKEALLNPKIDPNHREIRVGGWRSIEVSRDDVAICAHLGMNITNLKFDLFGLSNRLDLDGTTFKDLEEFNGFIAKAKENYIREQAQKRFEQKKEEIMSSSKVEQEVLNKNIGEIQNSVYVSQVKKNEERAELREKKNRERLEEARNIPEKSKEDTKKEMLKKWDIVKEISSALKKKEFYASEDGNILDGSDKNDAEELKKLKEGLSDELIDEAEKVSGVDLRREAMKKTGYKKGAKGKTRTAFEKYLTDAVKDLLFK